MKTKHILIITDNPYIAKRFEREVWGLINYSKYMLNFKCSPYSNVKQFDLDREIVSVDLKDDHAITELFSYDLIFSIHCKQLFPKRLIDKVKCINVHPGYNPLNRGWYPQVFAIINDTPIGATIHEIDEKLDNGKIIAREFVNKFKYDTSESLYNRVVDKEIDLLKNNIENILNETYDTITPENEGSLYFKKDFNDLCELNLDKRCSLGDAIDLLRALTHGDFNNAYFKTKENEKIYVSIKLTNNS